MTKKENEIEIKYLGFPDNVRNRFGMYVSTNENADIILREIIDNACDEAYSWSKCDSIVVSNQWNCGYNLVADNGRGLPITMSKDKPEMTQCELSITTLHSGSKFDSSESGARVGQNGVGSAATNALSESYIVLSRITEDNWDKSIPAVRDTWLQSGPRIKKELYYILVCEKGIKVYEGAGRLGELEELIYSKSQGGDNGLRIPLGYSTIVMFRPDPEIFESVKANIPIKNLQYFLLIQEKFYKKKVNVIVNGASITGTFKPYKFELTKTITPADTSKNKYVSMYITFEVDPELSSKSSEGSVSGLVVDTGHHIQIAESCYEAALKSEFKITHKILMNGLKMIVIVLAGEVIFDSQVKSRLKSIAKVKTTDFGDVVREIVKIFRNNRDYWEEHVNRLNFLAESMKSLSAAEKASKMMDGSTGNAAYKMKKELANGFSDATSPENNRWGCELFICEGQSPAGSLKSGRKDTTYHAVLPLRGKILNVSEKTAEQALDNKEIFSIFKLIGLGIDINNVTHGANSIEEAYARIKQKSRYGKICISCDQDDDGIFLANSILYMFSKFARFLLDFGLVYLADSPLFEQYGKFFYPSDPHQPDSIFPIGLDPSKPFRRFKGLGSLNSSDIYDSFYNPATRRLIQVTTDGLDYAMALVEKIEERKRLLREAGILGNPYNFDDVSY